MFAWSIFCMFLLLSGLWLCYRIMVLASQIDHLKNFACKTNCLIWFVAVNLISTINLNSRIYSCFKHLPAPLRTSHSKEVEQSNNFPFQALFHVWKYLFFKISFKLTVTIEVIKTTIDMFCLQHKTIWLKFAFPRTWEMFYCLKNFLTPCVIYDAKKSRIEMIFYS